MYDSENFKIYAMDVDKEIYKDVKFSKFGNLIIKGDIHLLGLNQDYEVKAEECHDSKGYSYKVINIKKDKLASESDMQIFLAEILSPLQASVLYNVYPDIVTRVVDNNLSDIDLSKLRGIGEYTFERIKEKIIDNYCLIELVGEFQSLFSLSMIKKLYSKYASVQVVKNKIKSDPYKCLCGLARVGFKTADGLLLEIDKQSKENILVGKKPIIDFEFVLETSEQRCLACILYLLEENENDGHTRMDIVALKNQCEKLVPACAHHFIQCVKNHNIVYDIEKRVISSNYTYQIEKYIANRIDEAVSFEDVWDIDSSKYQFSENINLTDEQVKALDVLCKNQISILNGNAGSGKTATTNSIIKMLTDNSKSFELLSPTGKAAKILAEYTQRPASTIHRGLGYVPPDEWLFCEKNKFNYDVIIIDEFSMVDIFLFKRVLDAIDFKRTKLLLIGDDAQLPSVSCGNLLYDFISSGTIPITTLTEVFRYGSGGLMTAATDVRMSKKYLHKINHNSITFFGDNKDYAFINSTSENIIKSTIELYKKLLSQGILPKDIQVLSSYNKGDYGSVALNNYIQRIANSNCREDNENKIKCGETTYYVDDIVIQKVNNYRAKLNVGDFAPFDPFDDDKGKMPDAFIANGETGRVVDVKTHGMIIDFDGVEVVYNRNDLQGIGLGYSISIHKSQGSSSKIVVLITPQAHTYMLNSNLIYVGLTRMKERCYHLGNPNTVNNSIMKKENFSRNTWLQDLIKTSGTSVKNII